MDIGISIMESTFLMREKVECEPNVLLIPSNPSILHSLCVVIVLFMNRTHSLHAGHQAGKTFPGLQNKIFGTIWVIPVTAVHCVK